MCFSTNHENFVLIFIFDLKSWTESIIWEILIKKKKMLNCYEIIHGIVKMYYSNMKKKKKHFILRVKL